MAETPPSALLHGPATRLAPRLIAGTILVVCNLMAAQIDPNPQRTVDSLFGCNEDVNWVSLISDTPTLYMGASFRTFTYSMDEVSGIITDFDSYGTAFRYVRAFLPLLGNAPPKDSSYRAYFELGTLLYRVWGLAGVDAVERSGDSLLQVRISQITDSSLTRQWSDTPKGGLITIGVDLFGLQWYCRRLEGGRTRAGFVARLSPTVDLPRWVLRFAYGTFVPQFLEDVRKRLEADR